MEVIEKIEKYLEGKLEGKALHEFENQLETNPGFKQEVEEFRSLIEEVKKAGEKSFVEKVQQWEKKAQLLEQAESVSKKPLIMDMKLRAKEDSAPKPGVGIRTNWLYVAMPVAAAIAILMAFWLMPASGVNTSQLYADNFTAYPDLYTNMGEIQDDRQKAIAPYNEGNYAEAVISFENFLQQHPDDKLGELYLAISLVESGEVQKGQSLLSQIVKDENSNFREVAQWYKALSYLKLDDIEACKAQLEVIKNQEDHDYRVKGEKLLEQL